MYRRVQTQDVSEYQYQQCACAEVAQVNVTVSVLVFSSVSTLLPLLFLLLHII